MNLKSVAVIKMQFRMIVWKTSFSVACLVIIIHNTERNEFCTLQVGLRIAAVEKLEMKYFDKNLESPLTLGPITEKVVGYDE